MKIFLAVCLWCFSMVVSATSLDTLVVFGDSLSDNGNLYEYLKHQLPVSPPYFKGRFSNGPVWVEALLKSYYSSHSTDHLLDYAFGGAGVMEDDVDSEGLFTLRSEMDNYFLSHNDKADANSLFVIWIGSNNYLAVPDDPEAALREVNLGIQHGMQRLVDKGAKHIMVVSVPNLGRIPAAHDFDAVEVLTYLSMQHNQTLAASIVDFQNKYPDVQWLYYDVNTIFDEMVQNPQRFGFTNVTETCYEESVRGPSATVVLQMAAAAVPKSKGNACQGYLFFDPVHPSATAHIAMAESIRQLLDTNHIQFQ